MDRVQGFHVGFTGTRNGMSARQKEALARLLAHYAKEHPIRWFHHGDCVGADEEAHAQAVAAGYKICLHPPTSNGLRAHCPAEHTCEPEPYLMRNQSIVHHAFVLVGAPKEKDEQLRSGTWATIRRGRKRPMPVHVLD